MGLTLAARGWLIKIKVGSGSYTQGTENDLQAAPEPATLLGLLALVGVGLRFNRRDALG